MTSTSAFYIWTPIRLEDLPADALLFPHSYIHTCPENYHVYQVLPRGLGSPGVFRQSYCLYEGKARKLTEVEIELLRAEHLLYANWFYSS